MAGELPNFTDDFHRPDEVPAAAITDEDWMGMLERAQFVKDIKSSTVAIEEFEAALAAARILLDERLRKRLKGL